jgi:hypothetical protein
VGEGTLVSEIRSFIAENLSHNSRDLVTPDISPKILPRP